MWKMYKLFLIDYLHKCLGTRHCALFITTLKFLLLTDKIMGVNGVIYIFNNLISYNGSLELRNINI